MVDRRASSRPGDRYDDDAYYRPIEAPLERQYGLPSGLLADIRKKGEKTDKNRVSSAGARSVYQIIPQTARLFQNKYGVNAYASDAAAAKVAALHLKESWDRSDGNIERTVREYHGGPNPKNWGSINDAYARRVTGRDTARSMVRETRGTTVLRETVDYGKLDIAAMRNVAPVDIGSRKPLGPKPITDEELAPKPSAAAILGAGRVGKEIAPGSTEGDATQARQTMRQAEQAEEARSSIGIGDRLEASWDRNWAVSMLQRANDQTLSEGDPEWHKEYAANIDAYEDFAENQDELDRIRGSRAQNSKEDYLAEVQAIMQRREAARIVDSNGTGWMYDLGAAFTDPVGTIVTAGAGKAIAVGGAVAKGAKGAMAAQSSARALAAEGAGINMGFTALLDASGENQSVGDYVAAGAVGVGLGLGIHAITTRSGKPDLSGKALSSALETRRNAAVQELRDAAIARVGPDADSATIEREMQREFADRAEQARAMAFAQRPDSDRFMPVDPELYRTKEVAARQAVVSRTGLDRIADPTARGIAAEIQTRSEEMVLAAKSSGSLDKGLEGRFLQVFGQESDALTLLRSNNPVLMATAIQLLESTTGAGGRKGSAAISLFMNERSFLGNMVGYDQAYDLWRRAEGKGLASSLNGDARAAFDRQVFRELEARGNPGAARTSNGPVRKAADSIEEGFDRMRLAQQEVGTIGAERLGDSSVGYVPHRISSRELAKLNKAQRINVEKFYAKQIRENNEYTYIDKNTGEKITKQFDKKFSNELAKRVLEEAEGRGLGRSYMPANLHSSEGADIISDAIKVMQGIAPEEAEALLGKFSRGGPSYTKGRLKLDLSQEIGDGMQLGDIMEQDMLGLYRSYSRRVAGEVALAQYGILGKQTLQIMEQTAQATGANLEQLEAFRRLSAEFLNQPLNPGKHDNAFRNVRSLTSASMLGGMGFTQLGEMGNAIPVVGVQGVLSNIASARRLVKEVGMFREGGESKNAILGDFDDTYGFIGGDGYMMTRLFDTPDSQVQLADQANVGMISKIARAGSHFTAVASGFRVIHAVQTRGMSEQIVKRALRFIREGKESVALDDMGITPEIREAFSANMDKIATFDAKGRLTSVNLYGEHGIPPRIIHDFAQTIERGAGQIIQKTFIGETGPWAHSELLKFLLQFRSFGVTSIEKQYGRNRANYGAIKSFGIFIGAMGFALPIHLARLQAQAVGLSRSEREKFFEERTNAAALGMALMKYTSVTGLLPDALDITSQFGSKIGIMPESLEVRGGGNRQPGLKSLIPGVGYVDKAYAGTLGGDFKQIPKLLPGSNLPAVTAIINGLTPSDQ